MAIIQTVYRPSSSTTLSGTFTVPAGVTSITVEVWGVGGNGSSEFYGGGGAGGSYGRLENLTVTPGQVFTYSVPGRLASRSTTTPTRFYRANTANNSGIVLNGGTRSTTTTGTTSSSVPALGSDLSTFTFDGYFTNRGGNGANGDGAVRGGGAGGAAGPTGSGQNGFAGAVGTTGRGNGGSSASGSNGGTANSAVTRTPGADGDEGGGGGAGGGFNVAGTDGGANSGGGGGSGDSSTFPAGTGGPAQIRITYDDTPPAPTYNATQMFAIF